MINRVSMRIPLLGMAVGLLISSADVAAYGQLSRFVRQAPGLPPLPVDPTTLESWPTTIGAPTVPPVARPRPTPLVKVPDLATELAKLKPKKLKSLAVDSKTARRLSGAELLTIDWTRVDRKELLKAYAAGRIGLDDAAVLIPPNLLAKLPERLRNEVADLARSDPTGLALMLDPTGTLPALLEFKRSQDFSKAESDLDRKESEFERQLNDLDATEALLLSQLEGARAGARYEPDSIPKDHPLRQLWQDIATIDASVAKELEQATEAGQKAREKLVADDLKRSADFVVDDETEAEALTRLAIKIELSKKRSEAKSQEILVAGAEVVDKRIDTELAAITEKFAAYRSQLDLYAKGLAEARESLRRQQRLGERLKAFPPLTLPATDLLSVAATSVTNSGHGKAKWVIYGNWFGIGNRGGQPISKVDEAARIHDRAYDQHGRFSGKADAEFLLNLGGALGSGQLDPKAFMVGVAATMVFAEMMPTLYRFNNGLAVPMHGKAALVSYKTEQLVGLLGNAPQLRTESRRLAHQFNRLPAKVGLTRLTHHNGRFTAPGRFQQRVLAESAAGAASGAVFGAFGGPPLSLTGGVIGGVAAGFRTVFAHHIDKHWTGSGLANWNKQPSHW